jgi:hypothetical protein
MARKPKLLAERDLPAGFVYPHDFLAAVGQGDLGPWEWLQGYRLRSAAQQLWEKHTRALVPIAMRTGTTYLVCFHADRPVEGGGYEVMTLDSTDERAEPVQHTPDFRSWWEGAQAEVRPRSAPPPPPPPPSPEAPTEPGEWTPHQPPEPTAEVDPYAGGAGWVPPVTGACGCVHHLDAFAGEVVPYAKSAPAGLPPRRVADLLLAHDVAAEPDYPGPELTWRSRPVGPFHWRVFLGQPARLHYDEDGRVPLDMWLMGNPGLELVAWPDRSGDLWFSAPTLCHDGVLTLVARGLLDDRVRRRK